MFAFDLKCDSSDFCKEQEVDMSHSEPLLTIILGSMFSGKTRELVNQITSRADVMQIVDKTIRTLLITHTFDTREDVAKSADGVTTHNSGFNGLSPYIHTIGSSSLSNVDVSKYSVIGIDEGQFFDDLAKVVRKWVVEDKKQVVISSLDGDFRMKPFGQTLQLIPLADSVQKRHAICVPCLKEGKKVKAYYTAKISGTANQKESGGTDKYRPVCMECHNKYSMV